jgi:4-hydroxy-tetrahydrodipicolinate reductase
MVRVSAVNETTLTRVGVVGGTGRMGRLVCAAVVDDPELELVAVIARSKVGSSVEPIIGRNRVGVTICDGLEALIDAGVEVAVDFTHPSIGMHNARWYLNQGLHAVIGTTGFSPADLDEIEKLAQGRVGNILVSPDFSPTGVVMLHIAKIAARVFDEVELLEIHPPTKADAPSGTTMNTARELAKLRAASSVSSSREAAAGALGGEVDGIRVHSMRLSGAVMGTEEIRFAHHGDTLTISATSHQREGYARMVLLAVKSVASRPGLTYGLEPLLGFDTVRRD